MLCFVTTFFPQEILNHWHRICPEVTLSSAQNIPEMVLLSTSEQTFVKLTHSSMHPLSPPFPYSSYVNKPTTQYELF